MLILNHRAYPQAAFLAQGAPTGNARDLDLAIFIIDSDIGGLMQCTHLAPGLETCSYYSCYCYAGSLAGARALQQAMQAALLLQGETPGPNSQKNHFRKRTWLHPELNRVTYVHAMQSSHHVAPLASKTGSFDINMSTIALTPAKCHALC